MSYLNVQNLSIYDTRVGKVLVENLSFDLALDEALGIIGESGSGKSLTCKAILGLNPSYLQVSGHIRLDGEDILGVCAKKLRKIRYQKIAIIFQDAMNAFDPICKIGSQMIESLQENMNYKEAKNLSLDWLERVGLPSQRVFASYPYELSGGMLQRVMIALALARKTPLILADEPTSALDVISQREIIELFKIFLDKDHALLFVTHDLNVASFLCDDILVMKNGQAVTYGKKEEIFVNPQEEYTRYLISQRDLLSQRFSQCFA